MVRDAITPGTPQPVPIEDRYEGLARQTETAKHTVEDERDTRHIPAALKECQEQEENKHLRDETKHRTDTCNDAVEDERGQPISCIDRSERIADDDRQAWHPDAIFSWIGYFTS